jgi:hypothetical protein
MACQRGGQSYGVQLVGIPMRSWSEPGYDARRFRKLDAPKTEIAARIRACRPADQRVPA